MKTRGSAIVETVLAAALAGTLLTIARAFGEVVLQRSRSVAVARYAAALASTGLPAADVSSEASAYAAEVGLVGATVSQRRFLDIPSASFYRLAASDVRVRLGRPPLLGGGEWTWTQTAVLEEEG